MFHYILTRENTATFLRALTELSACVCKANSGESCENLQVHDNPFLYQALSILYSTPDIENARSPIAQSGMFLSNLFINGCCSEGSKFVGVQFLQFLAHI